MASSAACSPPASETSLLRKRVPWQEMSWIAKASASMAALSCSISAPRLCSSAARSSSRSSAARQLIISTVMRRRVPWPPLPSRASRRMPPRRSAELRGHQAAEGEAAEVDLGLRADQAVERAGPAHRATDRPPPGPAPACGGVSESWKPGMSGSHSVCAADSASTLRSQCIQLPWPPCSSTSGGACRRCRSGASARARRHARHRGGWTARRCARSAERIGFRLGIEGREIRHRRIVPRTGDQAAAARSGSSTPRCRP